MTFAVTDWLGTPIEVGSPVLYAISDGHFAKIVWGEVMEIIPVEPKRRAVYDMEAVVERGRGRPIIGYEDYWPFDRTFKLKVQPQFTNTEVWSSGWSARATDYVWDTEDGKWKEGAKLKYVRKLPKPVFVQNVEKITVFPLTDAQREYVEAQITKRLVGDV